MIDMTDVNLRPSREIRLNDLHVRGKGNGNLRISSHVFRDLLSFMYNYINILYIHRSFWNFQFEK